MLRLMFLMLLPLLAVTQAALAARLPEEAHAHNALQAGAAGESAPVAASRSQAVATAPPPAEVLSAELDLDAHAPDEFSGSTAGHDEPDAAPPATGDNAPEKAARKPNSKEDRDTAAAIISGSRRPGILSHQIIRANRPDKPEINISYPSLGTRDIDADIRQWATGIADAFDENFNTPGLLQEEDRPAPELWGSYSISYPSPNALSITFEIWTYAGGAHGNLDIITLNYSLLTGQRLGLVDIFEDPDAALAIMSAWSHTQLERRLGGMRQEQVLRAGLNPVPENFASLTLIPSGIRINFQPYQVAPGAAGPQKVDIPLEELLPARPLLPLWGKQERHDAPTDTPNRPATPPTGADASAAPTPQTPQTDPK